MRFCDCGDWASAPAAGFRGGRGARRGLPRRRAGLPEHAVDQRLHQLVETAAMHQLVGHVQRHQAVQGNPELVGDLARLAMQLPGLHAQGDDFHRMVEQAAPSGQQLRVAVRRRANST